MFGIDWKLMKIFECKFRVNGGGFYDKLPPLKIFQEN
jgi:hypothetical protein